VGVSGRAYTIAGSVISTGQFVDEVCESGGFSKPLIRIPALVFAIPLRVAWWLRGATRWTPPVTVESLLSGSSHDGSGAARELGFEYTAINEIFG
jgi:hypothetical protein